MLFNIIRRNRYYDSVTLMRMSRRVSGLPNVEAAATLMGTPNNLRMMDENGLLDASGQSATPNDLIIGVRCRDQDAFQQAVDEVDTLLRERKPPPNDYRPRTMAAAKSEDPGLNLAFISVPGEYARAEAEKALSLGMHVFIFSDNVPLADEVALKREALGQNLLVMGPDCGTALIQENVLGFGNVVPAGPVGIVSASGTGTQEVSCLLAHRGIGISHAIGVGGRDLQRDVGGAMTIRGIEMLAADPTTEVLVLISKPADPDVSRRVLEAAGKSGLPTVACFLGADPKLAVEMGAVSATFLEEAADAVPRILEGGVMGAPASPKAARSLLDRSGSGRPFGYIRGLYSGGTLCYEALLACSRTTSPIYSNVALEGVTSPIAEDRGDGHRFLDLGADEFTQNRPHPMIDPDLRAEWIMRECSDPSTGVILLDVVAGYGAHQDPAVALAAPIEDAVAQAEREGRLVTFVASVTGTEADPQALSKQRATLENSGVIVMPSNYQAARKALELASR